MKIFASILIICLYASYIVIDEIQADTNLKELKNKLESQAYNRMALCIGINDYDTAALKSLKRAANDAYGLSKVLKEQGDFSVYTFSDREENGNKRSHTNPFFPTKSKIENFLIHSITYKDITPDDLIVVSFSGHGINGNRGNGYLLPIDWQKDKPFESAVAISSITCWLKELGVSKSLILLDACREVMRPVQSSNTLSWLSGEKFEKTHISAVFYATKIDGLSFEDPRTEYGAFTRFIIYGLIGKGDINHNGLVTFNELSTYVEDSLISWALQRGVSQRPYIRLLNEQNGDLALTIVNH